MTKPDPRFPGTGNYLDWLMELDPLELSATNIDEIIAYHRRNRAMVDSGVKPKKNEGPKVDLAKIGLKTPQKPIKRRGAGPIEPEFKAGEITPDFTSAPTPVKRRKA